VVAARRPVADTLGRGRQGERRHVGGGHLRADRDERVARRQRQEGVRVLGQRLLERLLGRRRVRTHGREAVVGDRPALGREFLDGQLDTVVELRLSNRLFTLGGVATDEVQRLLATGRRGRCLSTGGSGYERRGGNGGRHARNRDVLEFPQGFTP